VPVISAVGHETDFTIADFVADLRAATPSAAAELVVGRKDEFLGRIDFLRHGLMRAAERRLHEAASALQELRNESALADFPRRLQERAQRLDNGEFALARLFQQRLHARTQAWNLAARRFAAFDPAGRLRQRALQLRQLDTQAGALVREALQRGGERLRLLEAALGGASPERILARGYSITTDSRRQVVRDAAGLRADERLDIRFARGRAAARVIKE
jgi:exodeoxyribonuclease VII large subunit